MKMGICQGNNDGTVKGAPCMIIILWRKRLTEKYARRVKAESQRVKGGGTPLGLRRENNLINGGSDGMGR